MWPELSEVFGLYPDIHPYSLSAEELAQYVERLDRRRKAIERQNRDANRRSRGR